MNLLQIGFFSRVFPITKKYVRYVAGFHTYGNKEIPKNVKPQLKKGTMIEYRYTTIILYYVLILK